MSHKDEDPKEILEGLETFNVDKILDNIIKEVEEINQMNPQEIDDKLLSNMYNKMDEVDRYGLGFEKNGHYLIALKFYQAALYLMESYTRFVKTNEATHHLGTCHLVIARIAIIIGDDDLLEKHFKKFVEYIILSFSEESIRYEASYLRDLSRELFEKAQSINKKLFKELILYARSYYHNHFPSKEIDHGIYLSLKLSELYLLIIYKIDLKDESFIEHLEIIEELIEHYGQKAALLMVYEQFDTLIHAPYVNAKFRLKYQEYRRLLLPVTKARDDVIRIFISSVFSDFQKERDLLQTKVVPQMKIFCQENFGLDFEIVDLRWGIEISPSLSEKETLYKILSICGEMIEDTKPYFLLFIGNDYGTEVETNIVAQLYPELNISKQLSITEIEYLLRTNLDSNPNSIFLFQKNFKAIINKNALNFIQRVKEKISPENVFDYKLEEDELAELIISSLKTDITKNYQGVNYSATQHHLERLGQQMVGFEEQKEQILFRINENKHSLFLIQAKSGGGKTTFLANIALDLQKQNYLIAPLFIKNLKSYVDEAYFLEFVRNYIESVLEIKETKGATIQENILAIRKLSQKLSSNQKIVFLVDDYDQIIHFREPFSWKNHQLQNITFVITIDNYQIFCQLLAHGGVPVQLNGVKSDFGLFVASKLVQNHKKILFDTTHRLFVKLNKNNLAFNPLYITILLEDLVYIKEEDYQSVKESVASQQITFSQAMANHQQDLIYFFPNSLKEFAREKIKQLIEEDFLNEYLLAMLAFRENEGINLNNANEILEKTSLQKRFTSFLEIKYALNDLIEMENTTYLKCTKQFFIQSIFQTINPDVLARVAIAFAYTQANWVSLMTHFRALVYLQKDDSLAKLFSILELKEQSYLLHVIFFYPDGVDHGLKFIEEVETFSQETLLFMWTLLDSFLHSTFHLVSKKEAYAEAIVQRLKLNVKSNLIQDLYAVASAVLLRSVEKTKFQQTFFEHHRHIIAHAESYDIRSTHVLDYFFALFERATNIDVFNSYYEAFLKKFGPIFSNQQSMFKDSNLMFFKLFNLISIRLGEDNQYYLERFEKDLIETYGETLTENSSSQHIDFLYYLALALTEANNKPLAIKYYETISKLFYEDDLLFPLTSKNIKMLSTVRNNLGSSYMTELINVYLQSKEAFINKSGDLIILLDATNTLLRGSCYAAQNTINGEPNELNYVNYFTSNLNLTIYLMMFTREYKEALSCMTNTTNIIITIIGNGYVLPTSFIFNVLYTQMYMDYLNQHAINNLKALEFFISEVEKLGPDFQMPYVDFDHVYRLTNQQLMFFQMEKSSTYLALEDKINTYFRNK